MQQTEFIGLVPDPDIDHSWLATIDLYSCELWAAFIVPFIACILTLPGARQKRFTTFIVALITLTIGAVLLVSLQAPYWSSAEQMVTAPLQAFSTRRIHARMVVNVGLDELIISMHGSSALRSGIMTAKETHRHVANISNVIVQEQMDMAETRGIRDRVIKAHRKGLPFPMLTILDYLWAQSESFTWGLQYRNAGYYTGFLLWLAFSIWLLGVLLLAVLPHQLHKAAIAVGIVMLAANLVYTLLMPKLNIPFEGTNGELVFLTFNRDWAFYATFATGSLSLSLGLVLCLLQWLAVYGLDTLLTVEMDNAVSLTHRDRLCGRMTVKPLAESEPAKAWMPPPALQPTAMSSSRACSLRSWHSASIRSVNDMLYADIMHSPI